MWQIFSRRPGVSARRQGCYRIAVGTLLYAVVWLFVYRNAGFGHAPGSRGLEVLIVMGAPGGYALIGLLEATTGRHFVELADAWDGLARWKRVVFGTMIVILAAVLVFGGLLLIGWLTYDG